MPTSAETGEGIPELLMVMAGLAQKFLEKSLEYDISGPAKGTILEVKEEKGLGITLDVIIYDGSLKVNDTIVIGGMDGAIVTKVRSLLQPAPLAEMRVKGKFSRICLFTFRDYFSGRNIWNAIYIFHHLINHDFQEIRPIMRKRYLQNLFIIVVCWRLYSHHLGWNIFQVNRIILLFFR